MKSTDSKSRITGKSKRANVWHECITSPDNPVRINWDMGTDSNSYPLAWHDDIEIQFIKEGDGNYFIEGTIVPFQKKTVIIIQPREIHQVLPHLDSRVEKWAVMFNINNMAWPHSFLKNAANLKRHIELTAEESNDVERIICKIRQEQKEHRLYWKSIIKVLLAELLFDFKRAEINVPSCRIHPVVRRVLDHVEQHYTSSFSVSILAKRLNISERHLLRLFMADIGIPIKHYVLQRQISQAQRIIRSNPNMKLEAVSQAVGFKHYPLFYRAFVKLTGVPPRAHV